MNIDAKMLQLESAFLRSKPDLFDLIIYKLIILMLHFFGGTVILLILMLLERILWDLKMILKHGNYPLMLALPTYMGIEPVTHGTKLITN